MDATLIRRPAVAEPIDLDDLAGCINGRLVRPGDEDYDTLREVHQATVDARPMAIVRAADALDRRVPVVPSPATNAGDQESR